MPSCLALNRRRSEAGKCETAPDRPMGPLEGGGGGAVKLPPSLSPPFPFPRKSTSFFCDLPHPLFRCPSLSFSLSTTSSLPARRRRRPRVWLTLWAPHKFRKPPFPSLSDRPRTLRPGIDFVLRTFLDSLARVLWFWRDSRNLGQVGRRSPLLPSSCFISQLSSLRRPRVFRSLFHLFFFSLSLSLSLSPFPSVGMEANDGSRMQKADDERCSFVRFRPLSRL